MDEIKKKIKKFLDGMTGAARAATDKNAAKPDGKGDSEGVDIKKPAQDIQKQVGQFLNTAKTATKEVAKKLGLGKQFDEAERLAREKQLALQKQIKELDYQKIAKSVLNSTLKYAKEAAADVAKSKSGPPSPGGSSRAMKFPYTFSAKLAQFPWMFYIKHNWVARYYVVGIILSLPVFKKISDMVHSPASLAKWEVYLEKEREERAHHFD